MQMPAHHELAGRPPRASSPRAIPIETSEPLRGPRPRDRGSTAGLSARSPRQPPGLSWSRLPIRFWRARALDRVEILRYIPFYEIWWSTRRTQCFFCPVAVRNVSVECCEGDAGHGLRECTCWKTLAKRGKRLIRKMESEICPDDFCSNFHPRYEQVFSSGRGTH